MIRFTGATASVRSMRLLLASFLVTCCWTGESVATVIDTRIQRFEQAVDTAFKPVQAQLDGWRAKRTRIAIGDVSVLLPKAGPRDRIYLAYQLLAADPKHRAAREVYTALGLVPPFDESGTAATGTRAPACDDIATVAKAVDLRYPPFDEVTKAVDLRGSVAAPFWKKLQAEQAALRTDLTRLATERAADQAAGAVYPMLAFYQPKAPEVQAYYAAVGKPVPAGRTWFNPVDRWLLDRELAGLDPLRAVGKAPAPPWHGSGGGELPATVPGAAVEVIALWQPGARIELAGAKGGAVVAWTFADGKLFSLPGGAQANAAATAIDVDLTAVAVPVRLAVRGRMVSIAIGGIPVGESELPQAVAIKRWNANGLNQPRLLRVRFLSAAPELDLLGEGLLVAKAATAPAAPAVPAWQAERTAVLAKTVTCSFADDRLDEVAAALSTITGTAFRLAPSAEPLADLPVTMDARNVPLRTALEWLHRLSELEAVAEEQGFRLEWRR